MTRRVRLWPFLGVAIAVVSLASFVQGQTGPKALSELLIRETVESLATVIAREYMDADIAARLDTMLRRYLGEGRYATATTPEALATGLTRDLFDATRNKHLVVEVVREAKGVLPPTLSREDAVRRSHAGVQRVEILGGNVGYLNLTSFFRPDEARCAVATAMRMFHNADALILDLRSNAGGSPDTAALVASYFFDQPGLPLFEIIPRSGPGGGRYPTETAALPDRNGRRPVYVLTAARTFSAGEGLAFILQERNRAEVIGEPTAGAANPGRPYPVNAYFEIVVPNGRVRTAMKGGNWEGVGVVPDVSVPAAEALRVAHTRALQELLKGTPSGAWHDRLERELKTLQAEPSKMR